MLQAVEQLVNTSDRRVVAAYAAAVGLLWGAVAVANLDHAINYFGAWLSSALVVFLALLPTPLFLIAAAGLWVGRRWAWIVAALAISVMVGVGGVAFLAGSSN